MPERSYLLTPGPTPVPPRVAAAMAEPIVHHRSPEFRAVLARLFRALRDVFRTENDVILFTTSGSGAMESAVANLCSPGERVLVVSAGHFGERWATIAGRYGCDVSHLRYDWGETPSADDVAARLAEIGGATAVYFTHSETSTGVVADVRAIARAARSAGAVSVVDAISSLGGIPLETDEWGLDVVVAGSQKALMTPPGLALVSVSQSALAAAESATSPRFYLDWTRARDAQGQNPPLNPFTPAISLVRGLDAAVSLLLQEGLEAAWERASLLGRACRSGVKAMGLELFSPDEDRSAVVTAIRVPPRVDGAALIQSMRERFGVTVAGGQGPLSGAIVRIGHIGYVAIEDVAAALAALEESLTAQGADVERGQGVLCALEVHAGGARV